MPGEALSPHTLKGSKISVIILNGHFPPSGKADTNFLFQVNVIVSNAPFRDLFHRALVVERRCLESLQQVAEAKVQYVKAVVFLRFSCWLHELFLILLDGAFSKPCSSFSYAFLTSSQGKCYFCSFCFKMHVSKQTPSTQ